MLERERERERERDFIIKKYNKIMAIFFGNKSIENKIFFSLKFIKMISYLFIYIYIMKNISTRQKD